MSRLLFSLDVSTHDIVEHCELLAGHLTWLFVLMYKVMMKMSESERADQSGLYSSLLISSCDVIEAVTLSKSRMMVMNLAKRVTNSGWKVNRQHCIAANFVVLPYYFGALMHYFVVIKRYFVVLKHHFVALNHYFVALQHYFVALKHYFVFVGLLPLLHFLIFEPASILFWCYCIGCFIELFYFDVVKIMVVCCSITHSVN